MMGIPNEHQLKFNSIKDAKKLLEAVENRFSRNEATKKTQRNLLKHQYENFTALSSEMLDQTFDRLQKLVSHLEILDEESQEDVNQNPKWSATTATRGDILLGSAELQEIKTTKREHFVRECRAPRNQDYKNKESSRRNVLVETPTFIALVSCDGLGGYDWSDQAEERTNYTLMAYSSSSSDSEKSELMVLGYKTGLESVEERLEFYKKNESIYEEKIKGLKWDIQVGEITIGELRKKLEIVQKEKDGIQFNVDKFENASKSLNKLIESQIVDNCKKGLCYNAVPPPYIRNFMPPKPDLSVIGLDKFVNKPVVENCKAKSSEEEPKVVRKNDDAPTIEEWVSNDEEEDVF
ncbi:hypothetical protein Tco_0695297 [Tanacetum coccineum]